MALNWYCTTTTFHVATDEHIGHSGPTLGMTAVYSTNIAKASKVLGNGTPGAIPLLISSVVLQELEGSESDTYAELSGNLAKFSQRGSLY
jgi:hypothetical protein